MAEGLQIGLIGAGQMATALAGGWVRAGLVRPGDLLAADPSAEARQRFAEVTGCQATADNLRVVERPGVVVLAVKPQQTAAVLGQIAAAVGAEHLVVSVAAGVTLGQLAAGLSGAARLVRVMPNTPCLVGQGASAYCRGGTATADDAALAGRLFSAVGLAVEVEEKLLDAVTGLSGSGPAFAYVIIEALSDGGVRMGLGRDVATRLAAQTVRGAAEMVLAGEHPAALKDRVTSPGGTTITGLAVLEGAAVRGAMMAAVEAAARRAAELSAG